MKYDVIIVGAGPAGLFTALELVNINKDKKILLVEKGKKVENRKCPKEVTRECIDCKPYCNITSGVSGAGAFSDGKLSLSQEVGGLLPEYIGYDTTKDLIDYVDNIYLKFGADTEINGLIESKMVQDIRRKAIRAGLKLVDCPIRHLGTEKSQEIYKKIQDYIVSEGVELRDSTYVKDLIIENNEIQGVKLIKSHDHIKGKDDSIVDIYGEKVILCVGRKGADWLKQMCLKHGINHSAGTVDIGVRVEVRNEIMEQINNVLYEGKLIGYPNPFKDKVRTFCQNPGGFVSEERYDNQLSIVNGHSYKEKKSKNTNLAILSSHNFRYPFNQPIEYGKKVAELLNMLGNNKILVQRFGDILDGKRTWEKELLRSNVKPTLIDAVPGDLTSAIPYRPMTNIINFIKAMDVIVPGFASTETLLYGPEIKFYSNKVTIDKEFKSNIKNLHFLGDGCGLTRGLMMASCSGVQMARILLDAIK
ncbi:NAD(P)/FAD-dependent oxidoreductase [Clostridiaceae bacterium M8S5]|nr:NAD(P)/FAD-dependent oxidoreductase [Clostridiaceae bacterium M8S5]